MREITYSKSAKQLIRFFCINGIIVELLCILRLFLRTGFTLEIPEIQNIFDFFNSDLNVAIVDFISLVLFVIVLIVPKRIVLFAIISFLYSFKIILIDTLAKNPLGQLLYLMGISCLLFLGFYKNHRLFKIIFSVTFNFLLIAHTIVYGVEALVQSYIVSFGYGLVFLVTLFFCTNFLRLIHVKRTARVWDLSQYPNLTQRDKEWLKDILDEKRYEEIATASGVTVGTLKNRMHQIYSIVGIEDRIQLIGTYSGYEVKF
jgi:hypothetical protein